MPVGKPTDPILKAEILNQVKNKGVKVSEASDRYGIRKNVIYSWMKQESSDNSRSLLVELNRTKRELETAYKIIGKLTAERDLPNSKR